MIDCNFPIIRYAASDTPRQRGQAHGESWREAIAELFEIRCNLMREKNPSLTTSRIEELAAEQWSVTQNYHNDLAEELSGISEGSGRSLADLIVLNNYTDFRDIEPVDDQGCSLVYVNHDEGPVAGQTWDMHGSAKRYVCVLDIEEPNGGRTVAFSLVGCLGMMGFTSRATVMGVNNINTDGARAGALWPTIVRACLQQPNQSAMAKCLLDAPKTSGHNYLLADPYRAEMWEVAPGISECVGQMGENPLWTKSNGRKENPEPGFIFHTNHCLGTEIAARETALSQNSTTYIRHGLLEKKLPETRTWQDVYDLMNDHEGYPKSICSNFQTDAQDPSITCGGAVGSLRTGLVKMWRGDQMYDDNFVEHSFQFDFESSESN